MHTLIYIRRAHEADRDALHALQEMSMRRLGLAFYDADVIEAFIEQVGTMDDVMLSDGTYFAAFVGNLLVGCGGWSQRTPNYVSHAGDIAPEGAAQAATIRSIFVHPAWARRGIARQVMTRVESDIVAAGLDHARMTATLTGVPFYRRLGYRSGLPMTLDLKDNRFFVGLRMEKRLSDHAISPMQTAA
ncbi:MAG: GNAT family N-acetyltransferase [Pseudorhodoplanes sp.]|nr:GNAT family N-acetyltransferase [Pseudorhodoplanes sp.]